MTFLLLILLNIALGLLNISLYYRMRAIGNSGAFQAFVAVFNFSTAAFIAYIAYIK